MDTEDYWAAQDPATTGIWHETTQDGYRWDWVRLPHLPIINLVWAYPSDYDAVVAAIEYWQIVLATRSTRDAEQLAVCAVQDRYPGDTVQVRQLPNPDCAWGGAPGVYAYVTSPLRGEDGLYRVVDSARVDYY